MFTLEATCGGLSLAFAAPESDAPLPAVWTHLALADALSVQSLLVRPCALLCVTDADWARDLSPWPAPKAFRRGEDFSGGGEAHLARLLPLLDQAEALLPCKVSERCIAGYSLAGLFAVWAACRCDAFARVGSFSGSLWYDGFLDWALAHPPQHTKTALFSVGDREKKAREARMARVEECTRTLAEEWGKCCPTVFCLEQGGHFDDVNGRIARGIDGMLGV